MHATKPGDGERSTNSAAAEPLLGADGGSKLSFVLRQKLSLAFYTLMLLITSVGNQIYFKRMTNAMPNYGWYLTQLSTVMYVPIFFLLAGPAVLLTKQDLISKFLRMGLMDGLNGVLVTLGGIHTSGTLQVLLNQAVIPFTMITSWLWTGKSYHIGQKVGAAVIVLGIILAKAGGGSSGRGNSVFFNLLFVLAIVPSAVSSVYKEVAFRGFDGDLDVNVMQFWVASFQVIMNFLGMPIYSLKQLGAQQVPLDKMPGLTFGGTRCLFFLENQVIEECGFPGARPCDHCHNAWEPVLGYMTFNLLFNVFSILVIKHGSATLSFLVMTARMPFASLAFSSTLIMGPQAVPVSLSDYLSLGIIIAGLVSYHLGAQARQRREEATATALSPWPSPTDTASRLGRRSSSMGWRLMPLFNTGTPLMQPAFVLVREQQRQPRSAERVRHDLYQRLGAASPLHSPRMRGRSPPGSPFSSQGNLESPYSPARVQKNAPASSSQIPAAEEPHSEIDITILPAQA